MKFRLEMECATAPFKGNIAIETSMILQDLSERMAQSHSTRGHMGDRFTLYDTNGNTVGSAQFDD